MPWQTPGARGSQDRGSVVLGVLAPNSTGTLTITLNTAGRAQVQQWIDNPTTNHGFIISDNSNTDGVEIDTREASNATNRPRLSISFASAASSADFDADGDVDGADFLGWQRGYKMPNAIQTTGDADHDSDADAADLNVWSAQYGSFGALTAALTSSGVNAPANLIDAALASAWLDSKNDAQATKPIATATNIEAASVADVTDGSRDRSNPNRNAVAVEFDAYFARGDQSKAAAPDVELPDEFYVEFSDELIARVFG